MSSGNSRPLGGFLDPIPESWICPRKRWRRLYRPPTKTLRNSVAGDLLDQVTRSSPAFFERLVVDVLVAMGYGGSRREAGEAIGHAGDEGIDGIIKEDRLGLDIIYLQAKRWDNTVGRPEVQRFAGALQGKRARKGVFITTSSFSREATDYAANIDTKVILIAGTQFAELMIDHGVGVTSSARSAAWFCICRARRRTSRRGGTSHSRWARAPDSPPVAPRPPASWAAWAAPPAGLSLPNPRVRHAPPVGCSNPDSACRRRCPRPFPAPITPFGGRIWTFMNNAG